MPPFSPSGCLGTSLNGRSYHLLAVALFLAIVFAVEMGLLGIYLGPLIAIISSFPLVCGFVVLLLHLRGNGRMDDETENDCSISLSALIMRFSYEELRVATRDFAENVGIGRSGSVFKGMLEDGSIIAVKRLNRPSQDMKKFMAEVKIIGRIHHINLVNLIGYCTHKSFQLLVYEFMVNGSLDKWIFNQDRNHCLTWLRRKKIALDTARALAYLHEECQKRIIHLDIKPENILLDENFNARVSDFELSELIDTDKSQVLTTSRGTPGYIAPECLSMRITEKADVYSFGIVLLEIICGRRNLDRQSRSSSHALRLLQRKLEENKFVDVLESFDEEIQNHAEEVERMLKVAASCLQYECTRRPSMRTVAMILEGVMEVESTIRIDFSLTLEDTVLHIHNASPPPIASILSDPK